MAWRDGRNFRAAVLVAGVLLLAVPVVSAAVILNTSESSASADDKPNAPDPADSGSVNGGIDSGADAADGVAKESDGSPAERDAEQPADGDGDNAQRPREPKPSDPAEPPAPKPAPEPPTMPSTKFVQGGGFAGTSLAIEVSPNGAWARVENRGTPQTGKLTAAQVTRVNDLLRSRALADEAKRVAETTEFGEQCPDGRTYRLDSAVDLASGTCGFNTPVPTFNEIAGLLTRYTE